MTGPIPERVAIRAATRYRENESGCWISTYSIGSHGYAQLGWQREDGAYEATTAQRAAWTHHHGLIPDGMTVDHTCHVRPCVNPTHLRLLSNADNGRRNGIGRDYPEGQSCMNGHPAERRKLRKSGATYCLDCNNIAQAKYRARRKTVVA